MAGRDEYTELVDRAIAFSGRDVEFFARAKAEELVAGTAPRLGDPRKLDVLDIGCGIGLTDRYLEGVFASLTGADVDRRALERAAAANPWASYAPADPDRLPFEDGRFDFAFAVCVLQVVPLPLRGRLVAEAARVVRPGGAVAIVEHNPLNPLTRLAVRRYERRADARMLAPGRVADLVSDAGLVTDRPSYILLTPSRRRRVLALERRLSALPLGAQYVVWAAKAL